MVVVERRESHTTFVQSLVRKEETISLMNRIEGYFYNNGGVDKFFNKRMIYLTRNERDKYSRNEYIASKIKNSRSFISLRKELEVIVNEILEKSVFICDKNIGEKIIRKIVYSKAADIAIDRIKTLTKFMEETKQNKLKKKQGKKQVNKTFSIRNWIKERKSKKAEKEQEKERVKKKQKEICDEDLIPVKLRNACYGYAADLSSEAAYKKITSDINEYCENNFKLGAQLFFNSHIKRKSFLSLIFSSKKTSVQLISANPKLKLFVDFIISKMPKMYSGYEGLIRNVICEDLMNRLNLKPGDQEVALQKKLDQLIADKDKLAAISNIKNKKDKTQEQESKLKESIEKLEGEIHLFNQYEIEKQMNVYKIESRKLSMKIARLPTERKEPSQIESSKLNRKTAFLLECQSKFLSKILTDVSKEWDRFISGNLEKEDSIIIKELAGQIIFDKFLKNSLMASKV